LYSRGPSLDALYRGNATTGDPRGLDNTGAGGEETADSAFLAGAEAKPPKALTLTAGAGDPGFDALDNDAALVLSENVHHLEHRRPGWRAGVEPLLMPSSSTHARLYDMPTSRAAAEIEPVSRVLSSSLALPELIRSRTEKRCRPSPARYA